MFRPFRSGGFTVAFYLAALGVTLFVYRDIADNYLYNDDFRWMRQARHEMTPGNLLTFQVVGFFRPLMNVVFYLTERVMPGHIPAYYATNLVLHLLNGVLVFHLVARLFGGRALAAGTALLFLVTCTHWAAVGWISARTALISTGFLLLSMLVLAGQPRARWRRARSLALYTLALATQENAVIGVLLVGLLWWLGRGGDRLPDARTLVLLAAVTLAYGVARTLVIGHVGQENWSPGWHALRNLGGGFLYQFYPWAPTSLFRVFDSFRVSTHALWPEILALPAAGLLLGAGRALGRDREVRFGTAWLLISLLPVSMFRFRFLTTDWLTHDRYYYLSSVGMCLCIASLLAGLWDIQRARAFTRALVPALVVLTLAGERVAVANRAGRFQRMTGVYRSLVEAVTQRMSEHPGFTTCAVQGWPMQAAFFEDVFALERPEWRVVRVAGETGAAAYRPCVYVRIVTQGPWMRAEAVAIR
jgi:hypothetical protein